MSGLQGMSARKTRIVVFASGRGTNFRAFCETSRAGKLSVEIVGLVTNVRGAGAVEVAREFDVPVIEVAHAGLTREAHETAILEKLSRFKFDWVVLAGYMRLFTPSFIEKFIDKRRGAARIVNIHPSLLPAFPGKNGYAQAIAYGVKVTGATVHLVGAGLDDGPIVAQRVLEVRDDDTEESLSKRGIALEHELYSSALEKLLTKTWRVTDGGGSHGRPRVCFD